METDQVATTLGELRSEIKHVNSRLDDHIITEEKFQADILQAVRDIEKTLSEATGARKFFVWLIAVCFAGVALAKGWIFGK